MGKITRNEFQSGYSINKIRSTSQNIKKKDDKVSYPNGIIPFIFITLFYIISLIVFLSITETLFLKFTWSNVLVSVAGATLCLDFLWLIGRTGLFASIGYAGMKFARITKITFIREKINITSINSHMRDIDNYQDFNKYVFDRKPLTKKWCFISLITHSSIFLISLIIFLAVQFI